MKTETIKIIRVLAVLLTVLFGAAGQASVIVKASNSDNLNLTSSWIGNVVPGASDIAQFDSNVTSAITVSLGGDLSFSGIHIVNPNGGISGSTMTVNAGGGALTLGANGITADMNQNFTFNHNFILAANQTWSIANGTTLVQNNTLTLGGYSLTLGGAAGTRQFKACSIAGSGVIVVSASTVMENTYAPLVDLTINNKNLSWTSGNGSIRSASLTLNGGTFSITGVSTRNLVETNSNALTVSADCTKVQLSPDGTKNLHFFSGSFARSEKGMVLFRGTGLGTNTLASLIANSVSVEFGVAPTLIGAGGAADSTTVSILKGVYGDVSSSGHGIGLVTYDATYGLRLLRFATEYAPAITDGQSALSNVRYANTSGAGVITNTLYTNSTVNSLSVDISGIGTNSGVMIMGDTVNRQLILNSGTLFAHQATTKPAASDAIILTNITLNLNGSEGNILTYATGFNAGNTPAPLYIGGVIANDGGNGVTFGGAAKGENAGETILVGDYTNTYTGVTTVNNGYFRLSRSGGAVSNSIPGDLVMNGGTLLKNWNSIPDTATVTLNGGAFVFDASTSSGNNGHQETFSNLVMNGGGISHHGTAATLTLLGNATIRTDDLWMNAGGDLSVYGTATLCGGRILVSCSYNTSAPYTTNAFFTLNHVVISNQSSGVYAPLVLNSHATYRGGKLEIDGNVTVVGNASNTNGVAIVSSDDSLANQGFIALNGTRTMTVEDGPATDDFTITPVIDNNGASVGGLTKAGAGTLKLIGTNLYTGATTVSNGTLVLSGSLASPVTVCSNAIFTGTGTVTAPGSAVTVNAGGIIDPGSVGGMGTLTVTGNVSFANGGVLRVDASGANSDLLVATGTVTGASSPVAVTVNVVGAGPWTIMRAANITADFTVNSPDLVLKKVNSNTELLLYRGARGTTLIIR